jgi:predicted DNA-binding protein (MmcQ/YjbR family)
VNAGLTGHLLLGKLLKLSEAGAAMTVDEIREYCMTFPQATENLQWGDDLCFKIGGKIFAILALTAVPQKVCFKCTPEKFGELIEREDIAPAPYVGRYKWVIMHRLDALGHDELKDLIRQSYEIVAANAPKGIRKKKRMRSRKKASSRPGHTPRKRRKTR